MRKLISFTLIILIFVSSLNASLIPTRDPYFDKDSLFSSPARLIEESGTIPFGISVNAFSAVDYLSYLANPSSSLSEASDYLYDEMMNGDLAFWQENYSKLSSAFDFDSSNFPSYSSTLTEANLAQIKAYLSSSYYKRFNDAQRASIVIGAMNGTDIFTSPDIPTMHGGVDLALHMYGGVVYGNGFGWQIRSNIGLLGDDNMLKSDGTSLLSADIRADIGYAFHLLSDRFTIGMSLELGAYAENSLINSTLLASRFSGDLGISEPFLLGLGFSANFGAMYRLNDSLAFTLDVVNLASFRKYTMMDLTDFVSFDGFTSNPNVYYQPLDLILRAYWDQGPYHVTVEFGDIVNQLIWMDKAHSSLFEFYAIPKVYFSYDISEDLIISTGLEYSRLLFGVDYKGFSAELYTSLNKLAFGISAGYEF